MKKTEYEQMSLREETYWWHVGRLSIVDSLLSKFDKKNENKILNIGCGTGGTIPILEKYGEVVNVDISSEALKFLRQKGYKGTKVSGNGLPFEDNEFDFVVALDVLEHIDQDREALNEWHRVLKPGGQLMITVPAHAFLWSGHDVSLHHFRRYTTKS
jgi:ubiquinone/menaquinone biosynthesis C-methylase UbiE